MDDEAVKFFEIVWGFTVRAEADLAEIETESVVVMRAKAKNPANADLNLQMCPEQVNLLALKCVIHYRLSLIVN